MVVLGVNCAYHESSACILDDGAIVAAAEEERFTGRKHGKAVRVDNADELPTCAIRYCLDEANIGWHDLSAVAYSLDPVLRQRQACLGTDTPADRFGHPVGEAAFQASLGRAGAFFERKTSAEFLFVPHHEAHAWYAMGTSPFERAAVLVMDGIGEGATLSFGVATRRRLELLHQTLFPASVGLAWEKVARFIGLTEYDSCKVMALAGLARQTPTGKLSRHLFWSGQGLSVSEDVFRLEHPDDFSGLAALFQMGNQERLRDISRSAEVAHELQAATERLLLGVAHHIRGRTRETALVYGGGVALNCRANTALAERGPFKSVHAGPASHDAGTAVGAAWHAHCALTRQHVPWQPGRLVVHSGPCPGGLTSPSGWEHHPEVTTKTLLMSVVRLLLSGEPVGWVEDRGEFGPRALGARSILADPTFPDVVSRLNEMKGRYAFEPLACSLRWEDLDAWFDVPEAGRGLAKYMLVTARPRQPLVNQLRHLLHADGTIRIHGVRRDTSPVFHSLLSKFASASHLPLLINTSLNPRGAAIPATSERAARYAEQLGLRHLVIDATLMRRRARACLSVRTAAVAAPTDDKLSVRCSSQTCVSP